MTCIILILEAKIQVKLFVFISFNLILPCAINTLLKIRFRWVLSIILIFLLLLGVCKNSNKYYILSNVGLFRCHKWIPVEILAHKHAPVVNFFFFDKFATFHEMANLVPGWTNLDAIIHTLVGVRKSIWGCICMWMWAYLYGCILS